MKDKLSEDNVECPCYTICQGLGIEVGRWCSYKKSELPPPGMYVFDPKETWCPAGVQANVMLLGYMLSGEKSDESELQEALSKVRAWAKEMRARPQEYKPA